MGDLSFPQADLLTTQGRMQHLQKKEQKSVQTKPSGVDDSRSTHFIRLLAYLYSPCALFSRPLGGKSFIGRDAASGATGLCKVANLLFFGGAKLSIQTKNGERRRHTSCTYALQSDPKNGVSRDQPKGRRHFAIDLGYVRRVRNAKLESERLPSKVRTMPKRVQRGKKLRDNLHFLVLFLNLLSPIND